MEFRIRLPSKRRQTGYTLVEFLVSLSLSLLSVGLIAAMWLNSSRSTASLACYVDLDSNARKALERLTMDLRQATNITSFSASKIVLMEPADGEVTYSWDAKTRIFQCNKSKGVTTLLTDCDSLIFSMYKAFPMDGMMDLEATTRLKECKAVKVTWNCSRVVFGSKSNKENITSATVVLRMRN
jgi:hypothetical protein